MSTAAVVGDFVLAGGPDAARWLEHLPGFRISTPTQDAVTLAVRGQVLQGDNAAGRRWVALADLIEGRIEDAAMAGEPTVQRGWRGRFAHVDWDPDGNLIHASTDHFGSLPLYWYRCGPHHALASDLRVLLGAPGIDREPNLAAVYHYLNFACIPAPLTICRNIHRIEPGTHLSLRGDRVCSTRYYLPHYPADRYGDDATLALGLRDRIVTSVEDFRPSDAAGWGCFLSGGTDSSSIVSILARQSAGTRVQTCSIGFAEAGYDELGYARIAAEACGAQPHLDQVDRERALGLLDSVVAAYDQPFGNPSAIPTLACAELARAHGLTHMLGGDGGDEIFGGNQRYAKDRVMDAFYRLPLPLKSTAHALGAAVGGGDVLVFNRLRNFTTRASLPNPDRFYSDDSFASDFYDELLTTDFRDQVARDASLDFMRSLYQLGEPAEPLHRIMRLDLLMAIAQNDLVKVHRACKHHAVAVRFPYLDPPLVEYCGRLGARYKVRGLKKRYLFKQAMQDILPHAILRKPKQGFGLPVAVWLRTDPAMRACVHDVLLSQRTRARGWVNPEFIARLLDRHASGGWDHAAAIWLLLVLELWMRRYMDAH